ncbi:MAG TPA: nuclear transport factor 2 family protein [Flavobacteriaceae bacterium]|jgi:hypothetical protein|nr:DUF4440 domain-containing protein [Flavobacteriaceae bacterium]MAY51930.1 DUF4440 domain-containing protein [Flavobacteriaceae bacterium]HBR54818.1 nuclear transport factor 2 family protein [Flavobacteriaceae bacterium]HIB48475.1 nuclear transport factor 2 family protein [Flavobacteriaceae bacterium]HIN98319.1 nuclear transport factor 2 family protein [Flavobacteriaceae bacterium]|tara:strand:+ start:79481 stop:79966 length:486 start_codon:yes stop_codon:yes gene_type:complete
MKHIQLLLLFITTASIAQVETTSELYQQMQQMDSIVFDAGFNHCDMKALEAALSEDLEFYHDVAGTQNKAEFLKAMATNICGNPSAKITRELIPNSLQVFPLANNNNLYGAYVTGEHEFYRQEKGKEVEKTGYAKFASYYELQNETWKLKRVFSYDHRAAE